MAARKYYCYWLRERRALELPATIQRKRTPSGDRAATGWPGAVGLSAHATPGPTPRGPSAPPASPIATAVWQCPRAAGLAGRRRPPVLGNGDKTRRPAFRIFGPCRGPAGSIGWQQQRIAPPRQPLAAQPPRLRFGLVWQGRWRRLEPSWRLA